MDTGSLLKLGLIGAGGYLLYRYAVAPSVGAGGGAPGAHPPTGAPPTAGPPTAGPPTAGPPTAAPPPGASVTADTLTAAAKSSNLNPDQWNWYVVNSLHAPAFDIDSSFGSVGTFARGNTYTASDFLAISRGQTAAPATAPPSAGPTGPATALITIPAYSENLPPEVFQAIQAWATFASAHHIAGPFNTDEWNYYFSQATGQSGPAPEAVGISPRDARYNYGSYTNLISKWLATGQGLSGLIGPFGVSGIPQRGMSVLFPQIQTRRGNALLFPNIPESNTPARLVFGGGWR